MNVLDLFSGLEGWSAPFKAAGHDIVTVDMDPQFGADHQVDLLTVTSLQQLERNGRFDVVLASPPCECFSVAALSKNWEAYHYCKVCGGEITFIKENRTWKQSGCTCATLTLPVGAISDPHLRPRNERTKVALRLLEHTIKLIQDYAPDAWIIENPRAIMRKLDVLKPHERRTVTFCQYGKHYMKPTDLWGGFPADLVLHPPCKAGDKCHEAAPRGSKTGTQGLANAAERAKIPYALAEVVLKAL